MRLIDADKLSNELYDYEFTMLCPLDEVNDVIDCCPTIDTVEVVRCRDCIHDGLSTCPMCYIENKTLVFINHDPNFYCGKGEYKERR